MATAPWIVSGELWELVEPLLPKKERRGPRMWAIPSWRWSLVVVPSVRSRRDLVGKVFFTHYEPRVRDNERRALESRPLRGGPLAG